MITLQKIGDAIKFTFSGNTHYLQDGTVEVPVNSLSLTIDDSGFATFRKSASNDIFISATYGELGMTKDELVAWYKENMVDGGGSDITSGDVQNMIDESISGKADSSAVTEEISAAVSGKQDTLIAGENITISGNVISADGGGKAVSGGTNISITTGETADTINCTLPISGDTKGIYTTSSYPFDGVSFKSNNVVFGNNNIINKNGGSSNVSYNFMTGRGNKIADGEYKNDNMYSHFVAGENNIIKITSYNCAAVFGSFNAVSNSNEFASGHYNVSSSASTTFGNSGNTLFSVGNGTADNARHNAFEIRQNGDIYITSGGSDIKLQDALGGGNNVVELTQAEYDALVESGTVDSSAFYIITDAVAFDPSTKVDTSAFTAYSAATDATLSGKADTSAVTESINAAVSGKQDTLSAGTGIDITDNVISATGGGGKAIEAGRGISVTTGETADTVSLDLKVYSNSNGDVICNTNDNTFSGKHSSNFICGYGHSISGNFLSNIHYNAVFGFSNTVANSSLVNDKGFSGVFGQYNYVNASYALVSGLKNKINNDYEFASGAYNNSNTGSTDADKTLFSVGNGTSNDARHNAFEIRQNGDIYITSGGTDIKLQDNLGGGSTYTAGKGIIITGSSNAITLDANIYKGNGIASVSVNNPSGSGNGYNKISGMTSFGAGWMVATNNIDEAAFGYFNKSNGGSEQFTHSSGNTLFSVGNGTADNARHNAFEIRQNGDIYITSGGTDIKLQDNLGGGEVSSAITSGDTNAVAGGAVYDKFDEVEQVTAAALINLNDKFGGLSLVKLTQSAYDALSPNYDNNTLYVIV